MLSGKPPFTEGDTADVMRQHLCSPAPEIKNDSIPSYLKRLCLRMLSKNDYDRPANCYEIIHKLSAGTSSSITHDDFVRPTILRDTLGSSYSKEQSTKLPDYSALKKRTNPDSYRTSSGEHAATSSGSHIRKRGRKRFNSSESISSYMEFEEPTSYSKIMLNLVAVGLIAVLAQYFLLPWESLSQLSNGYKTSLNFYLRLAQCLLGFSIVLSIPNALVAIFRPKYMREKKEFLVC